MQMLTVAAFRHDTECRRQDDTAHGARSSLSSSEDEHDEDEHPIDGAPSPPRRLRPRRRFVKSVQTTYELSFSRHQDYARRARGGRSEAAAVQVQRNGRDEFKPVAVVSSLSHVLTEVMTGKTKALNNIVDTTPPQPNVVYVVEHAADGTPYVAASDGNKYFANSAIGQIFIKPVLNDTKVGHGERSKLEQVQLGDSRRKWRPHRQQPQSTRQSEPLDAGKPVNLASSLPMYVATTSTEELSKSGGDTKNGSKMLLGLKGFQSRKKKEKKGAATGFEVLHKQNDNHDTVVSDATYGIALQELNDELLMLDRNIAAHRSREESSWEVRLPDGNATHELKATQPTAIRLLDSKGMQVAKQARSDLLESLEAATNDSDLSGSSASRSSLSSTGSVGAPFKKLPQLQAKQDLPAPPSGFDAYDADDNPLCRSFQNVRNVDLIRSTSDEVGDEEEHEHGGDEGHEHAAAAADDIFTDVNSPDFAGRVRVSSGATSVADFVGGFKGQLSRRSGSSGLVNRKRAVRHARLTAQEQKAADLARKIRESRNRVPLEFRDENMSPLAQEELQKKKDRLARGRRVQFNPDVQCREFEVESEDEDDGYDSPDEIVDAVQLVSKRDIVRAEDVVAEFSMEDQELPVEKISEAAIDSNIATSLLVVDANAEGFQVMQNDPLTFSQLNNDKRMSFSDL